MHCPAPEALAQFLHGNLPAAEVELLQVHLDECTECFKQIALGAAALSESFGISNGWISARLSSGARGLKAEPPAGAGGSSVPAETAFGAYVVDGILGRGGMGVVYRARDSRSGAAVAIKTVRTATPAALEALRREILFLAEARHPGLVAILGHDVTQGDPWYAMELLEGETLDDRNRAWWEARPRVTGDGEKSSLMRDAGAGHLDEVLSLFRRLCEPLDFVHHAGIVHCDLKPANVFLRNGSEPILMDFGLAIQARGAVGRESLSLASRGRGTLPYMCPEVIQGKIPDARADLYALGCMLYESVVGRPPFVAVRRDELVELHLHAQVEPASARASGVPRALDELLLALLVKDPRERLGEVARVACILDELGARSTDSQVRPRAYLYRPQLVGRDAERQSGSELAEQALLGRGSFMMLSGESGIGKTFLVSEICQRAMLRGMRVVTGDCEPPPASLPSNLHAPRPLYPFSSLFNLLRDECRRSGSDGVKRLLGDFPGVLAAYSPTLAMLPEVVETGAPAGLPDKSARERVLKTLRDALSELARDRPLLIAVDDLQWADELSIAFLESLNPEFLARIPVLLIGTYRSDELSPELERLISRPGIVALALKRLGRQPMSAMVGQMLGKGSPPHTLVDFVGRESEGVPFFVAEYLRSALSESLLVLDRGEWRFERAPSTDGNAPVLGFPERLKELVRRRMFGLTAEAMSCLEAAAVLGRELEPMVLAHVLDCDTARVHVHIVEAMQRGMLEQTGERFRFAHDKFREVAYESLSPERQVELHAAVARTLESLFSRDSAELERRAGALARHFERGGKPERALEYLHKAGLRALQLSANAEAVALLRGAVELDAKLAAPTPALRRATWERGLAEALAGLGRFSDGEQHLRRAAALLGHPIASDNLGAILQVSRELARRAVRRFFPPAGAHDAPHDEVRIEAGRVYERVHRSAYFTGKAAHIFVGTLTSLNLWETTRPGPELVTAYANTAQLCGVLPAHGWTRAYLEKANRALAATPDPTVETLVRLSEGVYFAGVGERAKATAQIGRGITIAESIGYHRRHEECLAVRASIDIVAGHWSRAAQSIIPLEASARTRGDKQMLAWGLNQKLECCILREEYSDAEPLVLELQQLLPQLSDPDRFWSLGLSAYTRLREGHWDAAEALATAASALLPKIPPVFGYCIGAYDRLTDTWLRLINRRQQQGAPADAKAIRAWTQAERALSRSAKTFPVARPLALFQEGTVQLRRGRRTRAIATWRRGLALAANMQLFHQEARLSQALAKALDSPADRAELSRRARTALEALELPPDSDTSDAILAKAVTPQLAM